MLGRRRWLPSGWLEHLGGGRGGGDDGGDVGDGIGDYGDDHQLPPRISLS